MTEFEIEDSGTREEFSTGSLRDTREGKGRFELIPAHALTRLAQHFETGAKKYGDRNWEKGQPLSRYLDSAMRHLVKYLGGGRSEDHIIACAWNCFAFVQTQKWIADGKLPQELDDMNEPLVTVTDEWEPGYQKITVEPIGWDAKERELAREATLSNLACSRRQWIYAPPDKPRSPWQRFMARIGR